MCSQLGHREVGLGSLLQAWILQRGEGGDFSGSWFPQLRDEHVLVSSQGCSHSSCHFFVG